MNTCPDCERLMRLYDQAANAREYAADQVRKVGSAHLMQIYADADTAVKMAESAYVLHVENVSHDRH